MTIVLRSTSVTHAPPYRSKQRDLSDIIKTEKDGEDVYNYVAQIIRHSCLQVEDSFYAGKNYVRLARYFSERQSSLTQPLTQMNHKEMRLEADIAWKVAGNLDGTIYTYDSQMDVRSTNEKILSPRQVSTKVHWAQENGGMALLIFLCGIPSPFALAGLAVACHLDPEYLRRHLSSVGAGSDTSRFENSATSPADDWTLPSLLSTSHNIVQLRYTSIGRSVSHGNQRQTEPSDINESFVRETFSWDDGYVSIEQQISLCVELLPAQGAGRDSWLGKP